MHDRRIGGNTPVTMDDGARWTARACLTLIVLLGVPLATASADAPAPRLPAGFFVEGGTRVADVLDALERQGQRMVWSELLVRSWMRVERDATYTSGVDALQAVLSPYNLKAEAGPGNTWLVVRDSEKRDTLALGGLYGRIVDVTTGAGIKGAMIRLDSGHVATTTSDGRFRFFPIRTADYELQVDVDDYLAQSRHVRPSSASGEVVIELTPDMTIGRLALEDVLVVASRYDLYSLNAASSHFLTREAIERLPHLADDSNRALHRLPGVAAGDWSARFHLRGGLENEVSLVVDGLELFDPFHLKGLFSPLSMIDANVIQATQLSSGGFDARYGDHMSGVIEIDTMEAGAGRESEVGVSFVNAYLRTQGRFADHDGRWLLSARRGYLDLLVDQIESSSGEFEPRYYDVFAKADYDVSERMNIATHVLLARDDLDYVQDDLDTLFGEGQSSYAWVTIRSQLGERLSGATVLSVGQVERNSITTEPPDLGEFSFSDNRREVRVVGAKTDWEWLPSDRHVLSWGAELRNLDANYDYFLDALDYDLINNNGEARVFNRRSKLSPDGDELGAWFSHRFRATDRIVWETGLRWDKQTYTDLSGQEQWSPRVNLLFTPTDDTELRLAWGRYYQPQRIDELQVEDGVETFFEAQMSTHNILSITHRLSDRSQMRLEAYRKDYDHVRPRYENILNRYEAVPETQPDRLLIAPDSSRARGVELSLKQRISDTWEWWGAYAWSRVEDRIDGNDVPRNWDQRNALSAALNWHTRKWNANLTFVHHSGWPTTNVAAGTIINDAGDEVLSASFDELNAEKLDSYNRVDLRVTRSVPVKRGEFRWFFEVYNVFDSGNQCCVTSVNVFGSAGGNFDTAAELDPWMPRLPSFGFSWTF